MADGFARASGCLGIGGPGILNMTTALAASRTDRVPVIAISGEVARSWEGMGGFQDASGAALDDVDVLERVTGMSLSTESVHVVPHHLRHAITYAMVERMPVHLSVPVDVQKAEIEDEWVPVPESLRSARFVDESALRRVVEVLNDRDNPRIILLTDRMSPRRGGSCRFGSSPNASRSRSQRRSRPGGDSRQSPAGARSLRVWGLAPGDRCDPIG